MLVQQPQLPHVETLLRSFSIYAVWSHAGLRGLALSEAAGHRLLASSPADCCLYGADIERFLVSRLHGTRVVHPTSLQDVKVDVPEVVYLFDSRNREVVTLMAVRRAGRYEIDIAPASCSRPSWVPLASGTRCYADQKTAQLAGEAEYGVRRVAKASRPVPLFVA